MECFLTWFSLMSSVTFFTDWIYRNGFYFCSSQILQDVLQTEFLCIFKLNLSGIQYCFSFRSQHRDNHWYWTSYSCTFNDNNISKNFISITINKQQKKNFFYLLMGVISYLQKEPSFSIWLKMLLYLFIIVSHMSKVKN